MQEPFDPSGQDDLSARQVAAFADGVFRTLRMARALVEANREINLDGLQNTVGLLCARALDLPPGRGAALRGRLVELREEADALSAALAGRSAAPAWMSQGRRP